jgi:HSP20 family molecular chaperone IbpA
MSQDIPLDQTNNSSSSSSTSSFNSSTENTVKDFSTLFEQLKKLGGNRTEFSKNSKDLADNLINIFTSFVPEVTQSGLYTFPYTFSAKINENKTPKTEETYNSSETEKINSVINIILYDLIDRGASYVFKFYLAGHLKSNIDVTVTDNKLTVTSFRARSLAGDVVSRPIKEESQYGQFKRVVDLPKNIDENVNVESSFSEGILELIFQKQAKSQPKKIVVN